MPKTFKRYSLALSILLFISLLMVLGTLGIKSFGKMLVEDSHGDINPTEKQKGLK